MILQFTEEKLGSAEKTQYDPQFENLCARADRIKFHTERILQNAEAMLQPNPAVRLEEFAYQKLDKKIPTRSTNTSHLGQVMEESGHELGAGTNYGEYFLIIVEANSYYILIYFCQTFPNIFWWLVSMVSET